MKQQLIRTILMGGLCAGILDITAACTMGVIRGGGAVRVLQSVAGGLLGLETFQGGAKTAMLGLAIHFMIATVWATLYALASLKLPVLTRQPILCGVLYGITVYMIMYNVVLPLSAYHSKPFNQPFSAFLISVTIHMLFVGLPIALVTRKFMSEKPIANLDVPLQYSKRESTGA